MRAILFEPIFSGLPRALQPFVIMLRRAAGGARNVTRDRARCALRLAIYNDAWIP